MKASIEHNSAAVQLIPGKGCFDLNGKPIPKTETISVCAWCDANKVVTNQLAAMGYRLSHGICRRIIHDGGERPRNLAGDVQ